MASTSPSTGAIILYDIAHRPPVTETCCSPNPWKSRLALNFKGLPYSTSWVGMPDISKVRRSLGEPAGRQFADGTDFYTLPIIQDAATGATVGDSFDIAVYLQRTYPDSGAGHLFPKQTLDYAFVQSAAFPVPLSERPDGGFPDYARFNTNVDAAFTTHVPLMVDGLPLDPATADETRAEFVRRAGVSSWDDFSLTGEAREELTGSFRRTLGDLARLFLRNTDGPFLLGQQASYADLIVGAWLRMAQITLPKPEWEEVRQWHGGVFGRLHDALETFAEVK
ncbi:Thioredoxin-like fold protein [Metarhizium album ARSEF 1941]|uniref:Thioredoxin-like fold protein n=1 Tax=Metarhizium album (strain ARSEF 1941) TaxID=1081103 RepID=A0A0B2X355_METAS|nr:Thioredoxin-like fold protein [Metarhizium album ARSEF 1941]KHN99834.1 Thioredoxin-like fold protein [Metarhizium album ARSEF 1941]